MDKKEAARITRDMIPFVKILEQVSKYFKAGDDITILEIGVRRASSTNGFLSGLKDRIGTGHLYSVDTREDSPKFIKDQSLKENWTFINGDSRLIPWDKQIDVLFIDGDHSYEGVKADYERFEPFVKEGGMIIMHDITNRHWGVKDFWPEVKYQKSNMALNGVGLGIINKNI